MNDASRALHLQPSCGSHDRERWRRLPFSRGSTTDLLTGAEALLAGLERCGKPALRWSIAERPALILGSSQRLAEADVEACDTAGVTVHKRRSGGAAVFADASLLWLDVALPSGHPLLPASVTEAYRWFGEVWVSALAALGVDARAIPPVEARPLNAALDPLVQRLCFGGVSPYEVMVVERKLVGLAQVRRRPGVLLQAGIYSQWEPERFVHLLNAPLEEKAKLLHLARERTCGLHELVDSSITFRDVVRAWEHALAPIEGVELYDAEWTVEELAAAEPARERYAPLASAAAA